LIGCAKTIHGLDIDIYVSNTIICTKNDVKKIIDTIMGYLFP